MQYLCQFGAEACCLIPPVQGPGGGGACVVGELLSLGCLAALAAPDCAMAGGACAAVFVFVCMYVCIVSSVYIVRASAVCCAFVLCFFLIQNLNAGLSCLPFPDLGEIIEPAASAGD